MSNVKMLPLWEFCDMVNVEGKNMTKKAFVVIFILSVSTSILWSVIAFALGNSNLASGFPLKWSSFGFLGSNTNYLALLIDIAFWFIVIWGVWKLIQNSKKKK